MRMCAVHRLLPAVVSSLSAGRPSAVVLTMVIGLTEVGAATRWVESLWW